MDITMLQQKFVETHEKLIQLVIEVQHEVDDTSCAEAAQSSFNMQTADMVSGSEEATTKIEQAQAAFAALSPILEEIKIEVTQVESFVSELTMECQHTQTVSQYLESVRALIYSTVECPGMDSLVLGVPQMTYSKLRLTVTRVRNMRQTACEKDGVYGCMQLGGLEFSKDDTKVPILVKFAELGPLARTTDDEGGLKAVDNDLRTKWVDHSLPQHQATVVFTLEKPVSFDKFRLGTADDYYFGDPTQWKLEGTPFGTDEWEVIYCQAMTLEPPEARTAWMDWIVVKKDAESGRPVAATRVCAA